ncbi:MAG: imidazolonepropionase-like amidohydrolase [Gammaproteobacteria bacterium]|jgi:imidazolonepropionase-like amidohydrolase
MRSDRSEHINILSIRIASIFIVLVAILTVHLNVQSQQSNPTDELVIQGGILLDMVGDEASPVPLKGLVIRDGVITQIIAANASEDLPNAAKTIDASGKYILPGLIDAHIHFRPWTPNASIWRRGNLHYGVTTIVDTGPCGVTCKVEEPNDWIVQYKDFMNNSPQSDGPTLYMTGRKLDGPDGRFQPHSVPLKSLDEIPQYLDHLVSLGVDAIKAEKQLPPDFRGKIVEEADKRGLMVVGHSRDALESIGVGMRFIEHMWPITSSLLMSDPGVSLDSPGHDYLMDLGRAQPLIDLMVEKEVYINPTMMGRYGDLTERAASFEAEDTVLLSYGQVYSDTPAEIHQRIFRGHRLPEDISDTEKGQWQSGFVKIQAFIKRLSEAGGLVIAATDNTEGRLPGVTMHREMLLLADAGIAPYKVLLGATRWPAEMMHKENLIGTVETGKQADIILLSSNPLEDISNSESVDYVIRKGKIVKSPDYCSVIIPPISHTCN